MIKIFLFFINFFTYFSGVDYMHPDLKYNYVSFKIEIFVFDIVLGQCSGICRQFHPQLRYLAYYFVICLHILEHEKAVRMSYINQCNVIDDGITHKFI